MCVVVVFKINLIQPIYWFAVPTETSSFISCPAEGATTWPNLNTGPSPHPTKWRGDTERRCWANALGVRWSCYRRWMRSDSGCVEMEPSHYFPINKLQQRSVNVGSQNRGHMERIHLWIYPNKSGEDLKKLFSWATWWQNTVRRAVFWFRFLFNGCVQQVRALSLGFNGRKFGGHVCWAPSLLEPWGLLITYRARKEKVES